MLLSKEIKLTSQQWCDYVFDNKNKNYGAYQMRRTSSKRHISAFFIVVAVATAAIAVPAAIQKVRANNPLNIHETGSIKFTEFNKEPEPPKEISLNVPPPPPPTVATIAFTVPKMVSADEIMKDDMMLTQDKVKESSAAIGSFTQDGDDGALMHPDDIPLPIFSELESQVEDKIEIVPAHNPEYPGGVNELYAFVGDNLKYPSIAQEIGIQGTAIIRFVVEKDGSVSGITLLRGFNDACNNEAMRVIKLMGKQKWVAGRDEKGKAVRAYFTIPIKFKLQNK